eukprot:18148-Rhodomonas_salina.2
MLRMLDGRLDLPGRLGRRPNRRGHMGTSLCTPASSPPTPPQWQPRRRRPPANTTRNQGYQANRGERGLRLGHAHLVVWLDKQLDLVHEVAFANLQHLLTRLHASPPSPVHAVSLDTLMPQPDDSNNNKHVTAST